MDIRLSEFVQQLRAEIEKSVTASKDAKILFQPNKIEVEVQVEVAKSAGGTGEIEFKVLGVGASLGADGKLEKTVAHTIRLELEPLGKNREKVLITSDSRNQL